MMKIDRRTYLQQREKKRNVIAYYIFVCMLEICYFFQTRISATRRATMFGLHSIDPTLNEVSYFFSLLHNAALPSEANSHLFLVTLRIC